MNHSGPSFLDVNGEPVQKILPAWSSNLSIIRLEGEPKEKIPMLIQTVFIGKCQL